LKPIIGDHTGDATGTDRESRLAKLLDDDLRGSLGIKEPMADDLPYQFVRAAIIPLGPSLLITQNRRSFFLVRVKNLVIALLGIPILFCCFGWPQSLQFTLNEHGKFPSDFISFEERQASVWADQVPGRLVKFHQ